MDLAGLQLRHLPATTQEKIRVYKQLLKQDEATDIPFWDLIVLSGGDEEQKKSYQQQIDIKKSRNEIPSFVKYIVTCDPVGAKIGNGGATMHVLEQLHDEVDSEELLKAKVLLLHAGGYSQRLPIVSVIGKAFMALPCGDPMFHMLEALLVMYIDLPAKMNPGVFLTSSDIIFLYNGKGEWDMKRPGITAIAHPASFEVANTHGVFIVDQVQQLIEKYKQDIDKPTMMGQAKCFLHKAPTERLNKAGAKIPGTNQVYVDIGYYFDWPTADTFIKFYSKHKPLKCEIDAYGDFLQALGPDATADYCSNTVNVTFVTEDLIEMRKKVFEALRGTDFNVVIYNQAQFNHVGTIPEYLEHMFSNKTLSQSFMFQNETMVSAGREKSEDTSTSKEKKMKISFEDCLLMHTALKERGSMTIGKESVIEYCVLEPQVTIGNKCIVSNLHLPKGSSIPDASFLHTVPVSIDGKTLYTTFAFDINDSMKASVSQDNAKKLKYCKRDMVEALECLFDDGVTVERVLPATLLKCSLWNSRLFPVFSTRQESAGYAIAMVQRLKGVESSEPVVLPEGQLMSVADMLKLKSIPSVLDYHQMLRELITS